MYLYSFAGFPVLVSALALLMCSVSCSSFQNQAAATALYERPQALQPYDIAPVRGPTRALRLHRDGDEYPCTSCHEGFTGDLGQAALEGEHNNLTFNHGLNLRCLNCHNPANPDTYVYHDGSEIPGDTPTRLCAKCHGPHYHEWQIGIHGRSNGAWSAGLGPQTVLDCVQCHDPHRPSFQPIEPEPPPVLTRFDLPARQGHAHAE